YSDRTRHAHWRSDRAADRRGRYAIFCGSEDPPRFCAAAVDRRGDSRLYTRDRPQTLAMKILICSDGTSSAQTAIDLVALLAGPVTAETTLLGIAERSEDEQPL